MSRQHRRAMNERASQQKAAIDAMHAPTKETLIRVESLRDRSDRALERKLSGPKMSPSVFDYARATPYGKYWGDAKQAERDSKARLAKELRQEAYLSGGFVSESQYVSYVLGLLRMVDEAGISPDEGAAGVLAYESYAAVYWGTSKAQGLTERASRIAGWRPVKGNAPLNDPECRNDGPADKRKADEKRAEIRRQYRECAERRYYAMIASGTYGKQFGTSSAELDFPVHPGPHHSELRETPMPPAGVRMVTVKR